MFRLRDFLSRGFWISAFIVFIVCMMIVLVGNAPKAFAHEPPEAAGTDSDGRTQYMFYPAKQGDFPIPPDSIISDYGMITPLYQFPGSNYWMVYIYKAGAEIPYIEMRLVQMKHLTGSFLITGFTYYAGADKQYYVAKNGKYIKIDITKLRKLLKPDIPEGQNIPQKTPGIDKQVPGVVPGLDKVRFDNKIVALLTL